MVQMKQNWVGVRWLGGEPGVESGTYAVDVPGCEDALEGGNGDVTVLVFFFREAGYGELLLVFGEVPGLSGAGDVWKAEVYVQSQRQCD
jgi:hypothetical protein